MKSPNKYFGNLSDEEIQVELAWLNGEYEWYTDSDEAFFGGWYDEL